MAGKNQHVVPHQGGWAIRGAGSQRATSVFETQQEAISRAWEINKPNRDNCHEQITHVGGPQADGSRWKAVSQAGTASGAWLKSGAGARPPEGGAR